MVGSRHTHGDPPFGVLLALVSKLGGAEPGPFLCPSTTGADLYGVILVSILTPMVQTVKYFFLFSCILAAMPSRRHAPLPPMDPSELSTGQRVAQLRKSRGYTQQQLADKIGINRSSLSGYEYGESRLTDEMIARFAQALEVSADQLLGLMPIELVSDSTTARKIMSRLRAIEELSSSQQKHILRTLDALIRDARQQHVADQSSID